MGLENATQRKTVAQVITLARQLRRESCGWELVRIVRQRNGPPILVETWTPNEVDLFGMLAMMVLHRDHARGERGMFELVCHARRRIVAARVRVG
jgi:hypothetical protein